MKVLLTAPPLPEFDAWGKVVEPQIRISPNLGLYLLAAVLEQHGHQVSLVDPIAFEALFQSPEAIAKSEIDVLAISSNSCTWPRVKKLLLALEKLPSRPRIVLGGLHVSLLDEYVARTAPADYLIRGEAEKSFPKLLANLAQGKDPAEVPGITFRRGDEVIRTPLGPLLSPEELAELPLPKFELMPEGYYDAIPIETSRGCFYACIFCSIAYKRSWRGIKPQVLAERFQKLLPHLARTRKRYFFIVDDCFTADHERLIQVAEQWAGIHSQLVFEARITDLITPGLLEAITKLPVGVMEMGVEAGYEEGLRKVGKKLTVAEVNLAAELLAKHGLSEKARFSFIMGLPWETRREIFKTLEFAFKLAHRQNSRLIVSWLRVFPESLVWRKRKEWGMQIEAEDFEQERWWMSEDVFRRTHPRVDLDRDIAPILTYVKFLMRLFPDIRHDGDFKWL